VKWLEGSYPNFFFDVDLNNIEEFARQCETIRDAKSYEKFVNRYGVRRTNSSFWEISDWFQDNFKQKKPVLSGLFDLNRYQNR